MASQVNLLSRQESGARPLKRAIQRLIQEPLAVKILDGEILPGHSVTVDGDLKRVEMEFGARQRHRVSACAPFDRGPAET